MQMYQIYPKLPMKMKFWVKFGFDWTPEPWTSFRVVARVDVSTLTNKQTDENLHVSESDPKFLTKWHMQTV